MICNENVDPVRPCSTDLTVGVNMLHTLLNSHLFLAEVSTLIQRVVYPNTKFSLHQGVYRASIGENGVGINELSALTAVTVSLFLLLTYALSCRST